MCTGLEALAAAAIVGSVGTTVASIASQKKPPPIPELPTAPQEDKVAKTNIASEIKRQKSRVGSTKPKNTLLSGGTVTDDTLNLSQPTLLGSR